jgi:hypothetical protein
MTGTGAPSYWGTPSFGQSEKRFDYAHIGAPMAIGIKGEFGDNGG